MALRLAGGFCNFLGIESGVNRAVGSKGRGLFPSQAVAIV